MTNRRPEWQRALIRQYRQVRYGRFETIRQATGGMLKPQVYQKYYNVVRALPDLDIVEVGAGGGASSIAFAWGMQDAGHDSRLIVVEKCEGGSRAEYGGYDDNYDLLTGNFSQFGVADQIRLFPHYLTMDNKDEVLALVQTRQIAGLIHDADGRIDRDFAIFWPLLIRHGLIIVDDFEDKPEFKPVSETSPDGGTKKLTTYRLLEQFMAWKLIDVDSIEDGTVFGHKPAGVEFDVFDQARCDEIVAQVLAEREAYLAADN